MWRLAFYLAVIAAIVAGLHWLSNEPGTIRIDWGGYLIETTAFRGVVALGLLTALLMMIWNIVRHIWRSPAAVGQIFNKRRERRGLEALSTGLIALGTGDSSGATRAAVAARKALPNEPLTHLLRAQAAQLQGDSPTARRIFQAMLSAPDTEQLGLRGLFTEAEKAGEVDAAMDFARRALDINPKLDWAAINLLDLQTKAEMWDEALETLNLARKHGHIDRASADRQRAVILTANAARLEDENAERALSLATEAHHLAPDLVPAAVLAGRILAARGVVPKAAKILQKTWRQSPHPEVAFTYAHARVGDSPKDRLDRVRALVKSDPGGIEGPIAVAMQAMDARQWDLARNALEGLVPDDATQRVYLLLARIEGEGFNNSGRAREYLARAVSAPRDPVWTADGVVTPEWAPLSPKTRKLDAFQWKVPVANLDTEETRRIADRVEQLVALGATRPPTSEPRLADARLVDSQSSPAATPPGAEPAPARVPPSERPPVTVTAEPVSKPHATREAPSSRSAPTPSAPVPDAVRSAVTAVVQGHSATAPTSPAPQRSSVRDAETFVVDPRLHAPDDPGPSVRDSGARKKSEVERLRQAAKI